MDESLKPIVSAAIIRKVGFCTRCEFHNNGKALPFFGKKAKYLLIGEAPHVEEVKQGTPFVGDSGETMWKLIKDVVNLERDDFIIMNSVMCKPTVPFGKTVGKPKKANIDWCLIRSTNALDYIHKAYGINHILALGNYAKFIFDGEMKGIEKISGETKLVCFHGIDFAVTFCIHPASILYNPGNKKKFEDSLISFKEAITFGVNS
jgi:uracil-DNA glycosylase